MTVNNIAELVKSAFGDASNSLRFLEFWTEPVDAKTAIECVKAVGDYNDFDPEVVSEAMQKLMALDPNISFVVGRESSPVLYVYRSSLNDLEIMGVLFIARPDELNSTKELGGRCREHGTVRAWWD